MGERADRRLWREKGGERVAAVEKIKEKRKPADFFGHRNRGSNPQIATQIRNLRMAGCHFAHGQKDIRESQSCDSRMC